MKPEYEKICSDIDTELASERLSLSARAAVRMAVTKCAALAAKPRELTEAECVEIWRAFEKESEVVASVRVMVAQADEIRARPAEPETVPFSFLTFMDGGWIAKRHNGPEDEVLVPRCVYVTMRRKP